MKNLRSGKVVLETTVGETQYVVIRRSKGVYVVWQDNQIRDMYTATKVETKVVGGKAYLVRHVAGLQLFDLLGPISEEVK